MEIVLGLDISLNSPGIAVRDISNNRVFLFFFTQRKREAGFTYSTDFSENPNPFHVTIEGIEFDKDDEKERKIDVIRRALEDVIAKFKPTRAVIEDYAYSASTSCITQLAEIGGVVRNVLYRNNTPFTTVAVSSLKKGFAGHGAATKEKMYEAYIARGFPDLIGILRVKKPTDKPVEDLVDALALTFH